MVIGPRRVNAYWAAKPARCIRLWKRSFMVPHARDLIGTAHLQMILQVLAHAFQVMF